MNVRPHSAMETNVALCSDPEVPASNPAHARIRMIRHNLATQAAAAERRGLWLDHVDGTIFEAAATLKAIIGRVAPTVDFPAEIIPAPADPSAMAEAEDDAAAAVDLNATPVVYEPQHDQQYQQCEARQEQQQPRCHHPDGRGHRSEAARHGGFHQQHQRQHGLPDGNTGWGRSHHAQQHQHQHGQQQSNDAINSDCPADLTAWLCAAPVGAHGLTNQQFVIALSNLAPAQLQRQTPTFFRGLIPTLISWLRDPCSAAQALALLHEGFVVNEQLRTSLQGRQVAEAISGLFLSSSAGASHARACNVDLNIAAVLAQHLAAANGLMVPGVRRSST